MLRFATLMTLMALTTIARADDSAPPEPDDMKVIFNGKDLTGWDGDPTLWSVRDGAIHGETTPDNPSRWRWSSRHN